MPPVRKRPLPVYPPQRTSLVAQSKVSGAQRRGTQPSRAPIAPPVYRPQPVPTVLQRRTSEGQPRGAQLTHKPQPPGVQSRKPVAPPVYRPQSPPKVLQGKISRAQQSPNQSQHVAKAPPVYRPQPAPKCLQPKISGGQNLQSGKSARSPVAPPVYRPEQRRIVQPKMGIVPQPRRISNSHPALLRQNPTGSERGPTLHWNHQGSVVQRMPWKTYEEAVEKEAAKLGPRGAFVWKSSFHDWMKNEFLRSQKRGAFDGTEVGKDGLGNPIYKEMYKDYKQYIQDDFYKAETLKGDLLAFNGYLAQIKKLGLKESKSDFEVEQGQVAFSTASILKTELRTGLKTIGVGPCVAVAMMAKGKETAYALAHFDSGTDVAKAMDLMISKVLADSGPAKDGSTKVYAWVGGGAVLGTIKDEKGILSGPTLFYSIEKYLIADNRVRSVDANMTEDDRALNIRIVRHEEDEDVFDVGFFEVSKK